MGEYPEKPETRHGFVSELSRRHVWRAAVLYLGSVWALAQGISQLGPSVGAPDWTVRWFLIACAIGFPFWVVFAWFFAWTPQGFRREQDVERTPSRTRAIGRKLDFWIIGVMAVAIVLLITNTFVLHHDATSVAKVTSTKAWAAMLAGTPTKSVAVLPFTSADPKQQYFADGMAEELISDLTQVDGLKVIGKYSSFKFRDSQDSPAQIGATLGVANLIDGSVEQQGDRIRIVVGMIRAKDGASVWSHSYDQPLKGVFKIQSDIGRAVTAALQIKLKFIVDATRPPSGNIDAYQALLQGLALASDFTEADYKRGITLLGKAVQIDPGYAYAWANLSNLQLDLGSIYLSGDAQQRVYSAARAALDRATALAPNAPATLLVRGRLLGQLDSDPAAALASIRQALKLAPNSGNAMESMATQLAILGQLQPATDLYRRTIVIDPLSVSTYMNMSNSLLALGQLDAAEQAVQKALELRPGMSDARSQLVTIAILRRDPVAAAREAAKLSRPNSWDRVAIGQIQEDQHAANAALQNYIEKRGNAEPYGVADLYAIRKQPDAMFKWLDRALAQQRATLANSLLSDPFALEYKADPRFAKLCHAAGLPAPGEPLPAVAVSTTDAIARP